MFKQRVVFVHGAGSFGSAAWPRQHGMALQYDALFLRRHGFDAQAEPLETDFAEDARIVHRALMEPLFEVRHQLGDDDYEREYLRRAFAAEGHGPSTPETQRAARRLRLHAPPRHAPLRIVPGVPPLVLTGGTEP